MGYNKETGCWVGYIYCIENKVNGKKYIGQTIKTIEKRWRQHKCDSNLKNSNSVLVRAIKKYGEENFDVYELVHVESKDHQELVDGLNELEVFFIDLHDTLVTSNHGYNIQIGGNSNKRHNPICIYDMDGNLLHEFFNVADVAEYYNTTTSVVGRICKGKQRNYKNLVVFRYKNDDFNKYPIDRVPHSDHLKIKIDAYDANTLEYIGTFESISECCRKLCIIDSIVGSVCKGIFKQNNGYIFRYHGDPIDKYSTKITRYNEKPVNQYDKDLKYIKTYKSAREAERQTGALNSIITLCCQYKRKTSGGFKWYYASDPSQPNKTKIIS